MIDDTPDLAALEAELAAQMARSPRRPCCGGLVRPGPTVARAGPIVFAVRLIYGF